MESEAIYKLWLPRLAKFLTVCKLTLAILPLSVSSSVRKNTVVGVEKDFKYKKQTLDDMNNSTHQILSSPRGFGKWDSMRFSWAWVSKN